MTNNNPATVFDLIKALCDYPPDTRVYTTDCCYGTIPLEGQGLHTVYSDAPDNLGPFELTVTPIWGNDVKVGVRIG